MRVATIAFVMCGMLAALTACGADERPRAALPASGAEYGALSDADRLAVAASCRDAAAGRADGLTESDLISAVHSAGVDGEGIRNVRLLERFALLEVPADALERIVDAVDGQELGGVRVRVEPVAG